MIVKKIGIEAKWEIASISKIYISPKEKVKVNEVIILFILEISKLSIKFLKEIAESKIKLTLNK